MWKTVPIADLAEGIYDGPHATPNKTESGPWFLGISSLKRGRVDLGESAHLSDEDFRKWTRRVVPEEGDLVFSYETRLGEAALIPAGLKCCLGRRMALVRPNRKVVEPRFLLYAFLGEAFQNTIRQRTVHGSTVDRIPLIEFPEFPIRIPTDLDEQRRIVAVLGAIDDKIELNRRMTGTSEEIAQAVFKSWFVDRVPRCRTVQGDIGPLPKGWQVRPLADLQAPGKYSMVGGPFGSNLTKKDYVEEGVPVIRGSNLGTAGCWFDDSEFVWVTEAKADDLSTNLAFPGDVVFTQRGTLGQVGLIPRDSRFRRFLLSQSQMKLTCKATVPPEYVFLYFRQPHVVRYLVSNATTTGVPHINLDFLRRFPVLVPPDGLLSGFGAAVEPLHRSVVHRGRESTILSALRDVLLPKLISGDLRVPEAERALEAAL